MKPINEYTLTECIERLRELPNGTVDDACDAVMLPGVPWIFDVAGELADRISDLTRWIPVEERLPTEGDADELGFVLFREVERESPYRAYNTLAKWNAFTTPDDYPDYFYKPTHWRRIDKPEGV